MLRDYCGNFSSDSSRKPDILNTIKTDTLNDILNITETNLQIQYFQMSKMWLTQSIQGNNGRSFSPKGRRVIN